jgi:diguanylate cyclase (GGDEF)-like protein
VVRGGGLLAGVVLLLACSGPGDWQAPRARRGELDLRRWQPYRDGNVRLDGEWRYEPHRLLAPDDPALAAGASDFLHVPGTWDARAGGGELSRGQGYATYSLTVLLPPEPGPLALRIVTVSTAYRLFADGRLLAGAGTVATSEALARPEYRPQIVELGRTDRGELRLVLQASNFRYARGGVWEPLWLGTPEAIRGAREGRIALALFLTGAFTVIGLYHLVFWAARRRDRSPLFFAAVCLGMALRVLTVDDVFLVDLAPGLSWSNLCRLEYGSLLVIVAAAAVFLREIFPAELPRVPTHAYAFASLGGLLLVAALPPRIFSLGLPLLQLLCLSAALLGSFFVARAAARRRDGAVLFLIGVLAIAATGTYDTLMSVYRDLPTSRWLGDSIYLQPFGLLVFVLSQATLLALRFSRAFGELESASTELEAAHVALDAHTRKLEERVTERTAELADANRKLARLAEIDGLTRVGNRRSFDEELRRAWRDHLRRRAPLSLALVDVDQFKAFNDRYGHLAGDDTLRRIAAALVGATNRPGDAVSRYGGEELAILLPNTDAQGALHVAERVMERVRAAAIPHDASGVAPWITVSAGVATMVPEAAVERSELVELADRALYRAKQEGRNRIVVA